LRRQTGFKPVSLVFHRYAAMMNIRDKIVQDRKQRIEERGFTLGEAIPPNRKVPLTPFGKDPFLICEVKRKSPSRGDIAKGMDAIKQASRYISAGVRQISVLTEGKYFGGSLHDLIQIKKHFPYASILRKDFLIEDADIDVSYRCGADAVLLIAAILPEKKLKRLYRRARGYGMEVLFEVHDEEDIRKARKIKPTLTGINSRNLSDFKVDLIYPILVKKRIDWKTRLVFESGIKYHEDGFFVLSSQFNGMLVGESVMKHPVKINEILSCFKIRHKEYRMRTFWHKCYMGKRDGLPLVKICGITNREDAVLCTELGANILGFVFAPSVRSASMDVLEAVQDLNVVKVAVVVAGKKPESGLPKEAALALNEGLVDAVQFHGDERPDECFSLAFPYYKAVQLEKEDDIDTLAEYRCPRILVDAFSKTERGGTGKQIPEKLIMKVKENYALWLAGGLGPDNITEIIGKYNPELIDASSRLELSPGKKDPAKLKLYFKRIFNTA
jgi:indole-3-glycerol phosphate synthase/phosphoribosylanthranilate isomerase